MTRVQQWVTISEDVTVNVAREMEWLQLLIGDYYVELDNGDIVVRSVRGDVTVCKVRADRG